MTQPRMKIVAIGASAGGIEAFRHFFGTMPDDGGMGIVIVLHMAADHKSALAEIIGRWTKMAVAFATDGEQVAPNRVTIIPPGHVGTMKDGCIRLRALAPDVPRELTPIDAFFDSLAADLGEDAVGIVLSGTGHDGSLGLKAIRARGGLTLAQGSDGTVPKYPEMPDSAIATGAVDLIVPVQDMPVMIVGIAKQPGLDPDPEALSQDTEAVRIAICKTLIAHVGHDFSQYKAATFLRRLQRRMLVRGLSDMNEYATRLEGDRDEAVMLFRDLLIGVTTFFRDASAFEAVKRVVMPELFAGKTAADTVRLWVPGCATGEEAYSLAILLHEHMDGMVDAPAVRLFATDIDNAAIGTARAGRYPATLLDGLSEERRNRFFTRDGHSYVVTKELRDLCTFSAQSLVRDPPFGRMDLVSCRNLLIYMDVELQASVIAGFHYSLLRSGILLLGSAETIARQDGLFSTLDIEHRIFRRRDGPSPAPRPPSRVAMLPATAPGREQLLSTGGTDWPRAVEVAAVRVLERFAMPFVVVTKDGTVMYYSSHIGSILRPALGPPSRSLYDMVRRNMRLPLRSALQTVGATGQTVEQPVGADEINGSMTLIVEPLPGEDPDRPYLIVFREDGPPRQDITPAEYRAGSDSAAAEVEREMRKLRADLQSLTEEHETALEDLRSSNEELQSVNQELQSTNEELETSTEEIQSVNEELHTVNAQLSSKVDELDRVNSDLRNLFESTRVATVFLDEHMVIRAFTPEVASIYNLIPSDRGRPLSDIVSMLDYDTLREDLAEVLQKLQLVERRVSRRDGTAHYLLRLLPYRTPDSTIDGTVATFVDVTQIVKAEAHQRLLVDELNHRVKNMLAVVISLAQQTMRRANSLEDFSTVFLGRVQALTAAYSLLSRENWSAVQLTEILSEEMEPFVARNSGNIRIEGPPVALEPRKALALGLAVHELATNAAKYGALSVPDGNVTITWSLERLGEADQLVLDWAEADGPPVREPEKRGFGSTLIERALSHDLEGQAKIAFLPAGVRAHIRIPLGNQEGLAALE